MTREIRLAPSVTLDEWMKTVELMEEDSWTLIAETTNLLKETVLLFEKLEPVPELDQ